MRHARYLPGGPGRPGPRRPAAAPIPRGPPRNQDGPALRLLSGEQLRHLTSGRRFSPNGRRVTIGEGPGNGAKAIGGATVTDEAMLAVALHLRGQEMGLRDIAARLVITRGKKRGPASLTGNCPAHAPRP